MRALGVTARAVVVCLGAVLVVGCASEGSTVPRALSELESTAEDAFDLAIGGDVAGVQARAAALAAAWDGYRSRAARDGVPAAAMAALDAAVAGLGAVAATETSGPALARAANAVSEPMPAFFEVYDPPVPSGVLALDYLGREVWLDALGGDFAAAGADVDRVESQWAALRAGVVAAGGEAEAAAYDGSVTAERGAIAGADAAALESAAVDQLELVDGIESVFASVADAPD